ncbi:MAG TPA: serine/threonine-protein kinase [Candidatus Polarisedimenticolaceae bacterium]|nr:serine/threonine-protein kinase [Candidatus Polarisedimenticolaceae bacterium]
MTGREFPKADPPTATTGGVAIPEGSVPLSAVAVPGFRLLRKLGEGGFGTVFEAEQETPRRRVALKVVRGGAIASELHVRLFRREADMLARLVHPGIAAILESGRTDDGHHWFAMELVPGETLHAWLAARHGERPRTMAALRERLEIILAACDAVHYAHQRGVIHRDLKPSNLIVLPPESAPSHSRGSDTSYATRPIVKVLDFGLARLTDPDQEGAPPASVAGVVRGTVPYMSPEQVKGNPAAVDVRTDVYALGLILYEMLVDKPPYDVPSVFADAIRTISEVEPRPLAKDWPGPGRPDADLQTIVRKALEKDPEQRYASVAALGEDVRRWLASEPILAHPPSTIYQIRKLVARHRGAFAAAAVVVLLTVVAAIGMSFLYIRSERNLARALAAEKSAREEAGTAKHTYDFLVGLFDVSKPDRARSEQITAREILDRGADRIRLELAQDPLVRARLMAAIADVYERLGLYARARPLIEDSVKVRTAQLGGGATEVAEGKVLLAKTLEGLGDYTSSRKEYEEAIAILDAGAPSLALARALTGYGWLLGEMKESKAALAPLERARAILAATPDASPAERARFLVDSASVKTDVDDLEGAKKDLDEGVALLHAAGDDGSLDVADLLTNRGVLEQRTGHLDRALSNFERALAIREKFLDPESREVIEALGNVSLAYAQLEQFDKAFPMLERTLHTMEKAYGPDHPRVAQTLYNIGYARIQSGNPAAAKEPLERALAIREKKFGPDNPAVSMVLFSLGDVHRAAGDLTAAKHLYERTLAIDEKASGKDSPDLIEDLDALAAVYETTGDRTAAAAAKARSHAIAEAAKKAPG